ncbi:MAG: hypothetical protein R3Y28_08395 [Candidatus Gastranaerophilales bacterium]
MKKFKHLKTGDFYELLREDVKNCTNSADTQIMVLYKKNSEPDLIFVREKNEFYEKFQQID